MTYYKSFSNRKQPAALAIGLLLAGMVVVIMCVSLVRQMAVVAWSDVSAIRDVLSLEIRT